MYRFTGFYDQNTPKTATFGISADKTITNKQNTCHIFYKMCKIFLRRPNRQFELTSMFLLVSIKKFSKKLVKIFKYKTQQVRNTVKLHLYTHFMNRLDPRNTMVDSV